MRGLPGRLSGYVDVEIQADRRSKRDHVVELASAVLGIPTERFRRTRVWNLVGGQWAVRFYR